jgi:hypothetical protein
MSKIEVNQIGPQCGTTLTVGCGAGQTVNIDANTVTLGRCGATVSLAAGATQTGFGRTGTVDWDTTAKTASFTAVSGNGYFVNTTSAAVTMTLPATPSPGDIVAVKDYAGTFATNNLTIARNGSNLDGSAIDKVVSTNFQNFTMVYVDGTQGWIATGSGTDSILTVPFFVTATGGTVTCCGDYKIHTFTGPGTFTVSCAGNPAGSNTVSYMVVAGGGGGGSAAGGGGAGGFREGKASTDCYTASPLNAPAGLPVSVTSYPITIGGGGAGGASGNDFAGSNGANSVFSTITSTGGGGGGSYGSPINSGGSGGGVYPGTGGTTGGAGNTPPVSPPQGNPGGPHANPCSTPNYSGTGGGGATAAGPTISTPNTAGPGGNGATTLISGSSTAYAGGGGGSVLQSGTAGTGGTGGGANGKNGTSSPYVGNNGTVNTGGGAGAGTSPCFGGGTRGGGGAGGSGIVIIRYKYQ